MHMYIYMYMYVYMYMYIYIYTYVHLNIFKSELKRVLGWVRGVSGPAGPASRDLSRKPARPDGWPSSVSTFRTAPKLPMEFS